MPCRPKAFDLAAIEATAELVRSAGKPGFVVFMAGPPRARLIYQEAGELVTDAGQGLQLAPVTLPERGAFHHSAAQGSSAEEYDPTGKAAQEVARLWAWVAKTLRLEASALAAHKA